MSPLPIFYVHIVVTVATGVPIVNISSGNDGGSGNC